MSVTLKDVEHVANLARLELTDEEKQEYLTQMNAILKYAQQLNSLHTDGVEPTSHAMLFSNVMREDCPHQSLDLQLVFTNAPEVEEGQFKVPAVLD